MTKRIVVTGALGHIGSAFIHSVVAEDDFEVTLIDDMSAQRYCSLFNLPLGGKFKFVEADVCTADLDELFKGADAVIHLAAITDAASSFDRKDEVERVNFDATVRVANACLKTGARLIFPSTTSVYGVQESLVDESCTPEQLKPQSPYAEAKLKSEQWLASCDGLKYVVLRLGTIFGVSPGMRFHTAVNKFIWQACLGQPLTVWRTAMNQKRPYLAVSDAVQALRLVLEKDAFNRQVLNVVTLNATVAEIVNEIRTHVPELTVNLVDTKIMNQLSYEVSSARFQALGYRFTGDLCLDVTKSVAMLRNARIRSH